MSSPHPERQRRRRRRPARAGRLRLPSPRSLGSDLPHEDADTVTLRVLPQIGSAFGTSSKFDPLSLVIQEQLSTPPTMLSRSLMSSYAAAEQAQRVPVVDVRQRRDDVGGLGAAAGRLQGPHQQADRGVAVVVGVGRLAVDARLPSGRSRTAWWRGVHLDRLVTEREVNPLRRVERARTGLGQVAAVAGGEDGDLVRWLPLASSRSPARRPVLGSVVAVNPSTPADFMASTIGCTSVLPKAKLAFR